jgi:hypothetical protein
MYVSILEGEDRVKGSKKGGKRKETRRGRKKSTPVLPLYFVESQGPYYKYYMYAP